MELLYALVVVSHSADAPPSSASVLEKSSVPSPRFGAGWRTGGIPLFPGRDAQNVQSRLPVEIVERRPSTVYRGTVYDQDALVRVDGREFEVFDPDSVVTPHMVGTTREVQLNVWGYEKTVRKRENRRGFEPVSDGRLTVRGRVSDVERELLDVGSGTVKIERDDLPNGVEEGDFVELQAACAQYLWDVEGSRDDDEAYDFFLERLRDDAPERRAEAARYLGEKGSERCLDALVSTVEDDPVPAVRASAAMALGVIGASACNSSDDRDPRIQKSLRRARDDEERAVREAVRDAEKACVEPEKATNLVLNW